MKGAKVTIFPNGNVTWEAQVRTNVAAATQAGTILFFYDHNGTRIFTFGRIWSPNLGGNLSDWSIDRGLAIPEFMYQSIAQVNRGDYCTR
jgi:hypothetical protein